MFDDDDDDDDDDTNNDAVDSQKEAKAVRFEMMMISMRPPARLT